MAPTLTTPDGEAVEPAGNVTAPGPPAVDPDEVNRQFSRAMASDDPSGVQPPPRREAPAPGAAPRRRGRPRKNPDEKARATEKPPEAFVPTPGFDYTEAAAGVVTLGWATLAGVPWTTPYACVVDANAADLTGALANGAKHNPRIAAALEKAATGGGGVYMLQLAAVGANMAVQSLELMRDPALRAAATHQTRAKFRAFLKANGVRLPDDPPADIPDVPADAPAAA